MSKDLKDSAASIRDAIREAIAGLIERETLADLCVLTAVASEHLLVIGPPGTAKSIVVRRVAEALGGEYFEYLLGRFTEPNEIFGPVDIQRLREGKVEIQTAGMLPEAEIAFLDEVFLGSTAVLNTLLGILNERTFRRGHTQMRVPLRICVGASNRLPDDESLAAFADRFLTHAFVESVPDSLLEDLLVHGRQATNATVTLKSSIEDLDVLTTAARQVNLEPVLPDITHCIRLLRSGGITLYDRRIVRAQGLIAAAAVLDGRLEATPADLWPLIYVVPTLEGQSLARDLLHEKLASSESALLGAAAEDAAASPAARAARIIEQGNDLLGEKPDSDGAMESWRLHLEAVGREIDASFAAEAMTEDLVALRERISREVEPVS